MIKQGLLTQEIQFGKFTGILYPESYYFLICELNKHHADIMQAMCLAQVKIEDGGVRDFLNHFFNSSVPANAPMEEGYEYFYFKLLQRRNALSESKKALVIVDKYFKETPGPLYRSEADAGKPLFPSWDEMKDKGWK